MRRKRTPTPFGHAVKVRLAQLDMRQSDLAEKLGLSNAYVSYLLHGDRRDTAWVARICWALDMPVWEDDEIE